MELINQTPFPCSMFRTGLDKDKLAASSIVRITYDIKNDIAVPSAQQEWILHNEPWVNEFGPFEHDNIYRLGGIDILVFGKAIPPNKRRVKRMDVKVSIKNKLECKLLVWGNRVWEKNIFGMSISEPEPFAEMPLTLYNAFGGKSEWDNLQIPFGNNTFGKGFYWTKEDAYKKPLPNIEDPKNPITKWNDRPDPVGIACCPTNELRMRKNVEFDNDNNVKEVHARFFNSAFPDMIVDSLLPGEIIQIEGMTEAGNFSFKMPDHKLYATITLGNKILKRQLKADQVGIIPNKQQAFITYRFPFTYSFIAMQKRSCEIYELN